MQRRCGLGYSAKVEYHRRIYTIVSALYHLEVADVEKVPRIQSSCRKWVHNARILRAVRSGQKDHSDCTLNLPVAMRERMMTVNERGIPRPLPSVPVEKCKRRRSRECNYFVGF